MNDQQVADAGHAVWPGLKVQFITGYAGNTVVGDGHFEPMHVLCHTFAMKALASRIKKLITGPQTGPRTRPVAPMPHRRLGTSGPGRTKRFACGIRLRRLDEPQPRIGPDVRECTTKALSCRWKPDGGVGDGGTQANFENADRPRGA